MAFWNWLITVGSKTSVAFERDTVVANKLWIKFLDEPWIKLELSEHLEVKSVKVLITSLVS